MVPWPNGKALLSGPLDMAKIASSNLVGIVTCHLFLVVSVVDIFGGVAI